MKVLVIGGNGFIGSNFIRYILEKYPGWKVINYSRSEKTGTSNPLRDLENKYDYKFIKGDLKDTSLIKELISDADYVFNSGGESNIRNFVENPAESINANLEGIVSLLGVAKGTKIRKIVIMTSWEVYGDKKGETAIETDKLNPENIYAAINAAIENIAIGYNKSYGIPVISIRACNIFGPYQKEDKLISRTITNILKNKKITLFGNGNEVRSYLYIKDLCKAIDILLKNGKGGEAYNVGSEELISNIDLVKTILKKIGKGEEEIEFLPDRKTDNRRIRLRLDKITSLGWKLETPFEKGIEKTIEWYSKGIT